MTALISNRKAGFDYEIMEKYEAGIELLGFEVKAVRKHQGSFEGAYVTVRGGEAFLINFDLPPYQAGNTPEDYDSRRQRKLLLNKKQIAEIGNIENKKGLTIVPISMYNKGRKLKIEIAIVRGKKKFDKRETLKKRQTDRDLAREFRDR